MADAPDRRTLPRHLRTLFDGEQGTGEAVGRLLDKGAGRLRVGRFSRALKMSGFAVSTGSRVLLGAAKNKLGSAATDVVNRRMAVEMVETLSEMRGVAMKLGQMLSYLEDMMPEEARKVLVVLQRDAPAMPWDEVCAQFEAELGGPPESVFATFEQTPIAAASIGQVHRATTKEGLEVAVKIQYPGIAEAMRADLKNARMLSLFQRVMFANLDTKAIMAELEERFSDECDYEREARYQQAFGERLAGHPWIIVPEVHTELSTKRVLTTTYYEGSTFYEWLAADPDEETRQRVCALFYRFYLGSLYMDGYFNCDPHPGNYLFAEDGRVIFLDYGCTRPFPSDRREAWVEMVRAVHSDDQARIHAAAVEIGFFDAGQDYDYDAFRQLVRYLYQAYLEDAPYDFGGSQPQATFREMFVDNPNVFKLDMPPDAVFLNRIMFGLVSLWTEIGASLNCYQRSAAYFDGVDPDWPEDPRRGASVEPPSRLD